MKAPPFPPDSPSDDQPGRRDPSWARQLTIAQLAPAVVHDIGNALGAVSLRLRVMMQDLAPDEAGQMHLEAVRRAVREGDDALEVLRWLAAPEAHTPGAQSLEQQLSDARARLRNALRISRGPRGAAIDVRGSLAQLPRVVAGPHTLMGVFADVIMYAASGGSPSASIQVSGERTADRISVYLHVVDADWPSGPVPAWPTDARLLALVAEGNRRLNHFGGSMELAPAQQNDPSLRFLLRLRAVALVDEPAVTG